jgi:hypothetical protein
LAGERLMVSFDICIAYVSWARGGKRRPVLLLTKNEDYAEAFRITSKYANKSETVKAQYFKLSDWQQAGLQKPSYIDTINSIEIPLSFIDEPPIGRLTDNDKRRLLEFLNR